MKKFDLQSQIDWATTDAEDGARYLQQLLEDISLENGYLSDEDPRVSELTDREMKRLHTAEVSLLQSARRISEIKTTLATRKGQAA